MFYVWRRNDGYVHATPGRMPSDYKDVTFTLLKTFDEWTGETVQYIEEQQKISKSL